MTNKINHTRTEKLLLEAARVFNSTLEYEELIKLVLKLVMKAVDCSAALVCRLDHNRTDMHIRYISADEDEMHMLEQERGKGLIGWVAKNNEGVIINDPANDERVDSAPENCGNIELTNLIAVPLIGKGQMIGVIEAIGKEKSDFNESDLDILTGLSNQIAVAIDNANLYRQLKQQVLEKDTLYEVGKKLSGTLKLDEVLKTILDSVKQVVSFDAGGVFITHAQGNDLDVISSTGYGDDCVVDLHTKMGEGLVGVVADSGEPILVNDVSSDSRYIDCRPRTKSEIVVPVQLDDRVVGVLNLESDELNAYSQADIDLLTAFASQAAVSIERAHLHQQILDGRRLTEQLNVAREIQKTFLPEKNPQIKGYQIAGLNIPSEQVGGDYYDFIKIVDNQTGIAIADSSGKGIPASLIMASFRASLIAEIRNSYSIRTICQKVNDLMYESIVAGKFVTAVYGVLDSKNHILTFSNCGHNLPFLMRADGSVEYLQEGGPIMGVTPGALYEERPLFLNPGDTVFMYTDGISEVFNDAEEEFGLERIVELISKARDKTADEILDAVYTQVRDFATEGHVFDDFTAIVIKRKK